MSCSVRRRKGRALGRGGQRACERGGWGWYEKKGSRVGEDQLANLIIYPPQSLALWGGVIICRDDEHSADSHSV